MSNLRDVSKNINKTFLDLSNKHYNEHIQDVPLADVEEMIGLLTARRVRLREWIYWAVSAARVIMVVYLLCLYLFPCSDPSTTTASTIAL